MRSQPREDEAGFTLIEVLVAFLIASLVLTAAVEATAAGLRQMRAAQEMRIATMHAQSVLARLGADIPVEPGIREARMSDGFTLRILVRALPAAPRAAVTPHAATVSVANGDGPPLLTLNTIVLRASEL